MALVSHQHKQRAELEAAKQKREAERQSKLRDEERRGADDFFSRAGMLFDIPYGIGILENPLKINGFDMF